MRTQINRLWRQAGQFWPGRQEQAIAGSRLLLSAVALIAIYVDPPVPDVSPAVTYVTLTAYVAWSAFLACLAWIRESPFRWRLAIHALDIAVFVVLTSLTDGPGSPLFVFFTFAIVSGGLSWGARGAVASGAIVLAAFLTTALLVAGETDELNRLVVRSAYLIVLIVLIALFGWHREKANRRLRLLSEWPALADGATEDAPLSNSLRHAALILEADRLAVFWLDETQQWKVAEWRDAQYEVRDWTEVEPPIPTAPKLGSDQHAAALSEGDLPPTTRTAMGYSQATVSSFEASGKVGAVLVMDHPGNQVEIGEVLRIVSRRLGLELEQFQLRRERARAAVAKERERLARDLHDGILQDLTAVGLHLELVARTTPEPNLSTIRDLSALVRAQQTRIRSFVESMNPKARRGHQILLTELLGDAAAILRQQWQVDVTYTVQPADAQVTGSQERHLQNLLSEAVANAVRHGGATAVTIAATVTETINIEVADDGRRAALDDAATEDAPSPASLAQRVSDLGGHCRFIVTATGGHFSFSLPGKF